MPPGILLLALSLAAAQPSRAGELWASEDGDWALTGGGYLKAMTVGLHNRDIALYTVNSGAMNTGRVRLGGALLWLDYELAAEYEFSMTSFTEGLMESSLGGLGMGTTPTARPRLYDPDPIDGTGLTLDNNFDRLYVAIPLGPVDFTIGRQAISWGSAWFWKPTDRFSPFSPTDFDADVKRGIDALRAELYLGPTTSLDLVATFERHPDADRELWVHGGARFRTTVGRYDLAVSVARFQLTETEDYMLGLEFTGELGDVGFRGEAAGNYLPGTKEWDIEAVLGADYHFGFGLTLAGEFFYNGLGEADAEGYNTLVNDPDSTTIERLMRGEAFNLGRYYAGLSLDQEVHPLLHVTLSAIGNLTDPSAFLMAGLQWSVVQNARFTAGALVPVGEKPGGLLTPNPIRSEFGFRPAMGYAVMKMSF